MTEAVAFLNTASKLWYDPESHTFTSSEPITCFDFEDGETIQRFVHSNLQMISRWTDGDLSIARIFLGSDAESEIDKAVSNQTLIRKLVSGSDAAIDRDFLAKLKDLSHHASFKKFRYMVNREDLLEEDLLQINRTPYYHLQGTPNYRAVPPNVAMQLRLRGVFVVDLDLLRQAETD